MRAQDERFYGWMWWYIHRRSHGVLGTRGSDFRSLFAHAGCKETKARRFLKELIRLGHVVVKAKTKDDGYRGRLRYYTRGREPAFARNC